MKKLELQQKVAELKAETTAALQTVYNELNQGQQNKLLKNEDIKALFDRYGVQY